MGKPQEQTVAEKLRKQERTFLGTRRAEIEALASEGAEDLAAALRVAALQPCDAVAVVAAADKSLGDLGDTSWADKGWPVL